MLCQRMAREVRDAPQGIDELDVHGIHEYQATDCSGVLAGQHLDQQPSIGMAERHRRAEERQLVRASPEPRDLLADVIGRIRQVALPIGDDGCSGLAGQIYGERFPVVRTLPAARLKGGLSAPFRENTKMDTITADVDRTVDYCTAFHAPCHFPAS